MTQAIARPPANANPGGARRWAELGCPACGSPLDFAAHAETQAVLRCRRERTPYSVEEHIPRLRPSGESGPEAIVGDEYLRWWARAGPMHPRQRARAHRALLDLAGPGEGKVACDVGAGNTALAQRFSRGGWKMYALDLNPPSPGADLDHDRVVPIVGSMMRPPFQDQSLDLVVASSSLQYVPNLGGALSAWRRKLRPGGAFLCALTPVHKTRAAADRAQAHARDKIREAAGTDGLASLYQHFTKHQILEAFLGAGMRVEFLPSPFSLDFRFLRFLKGVAVGPDLARFPMLRARVGLSR